MKRIILLLAGLLALTSATTQAQQEKQAVPKAYRYRVYLADKQDNPYSVKRPEQFLSAKSLERRARLGIKIDQHDVPVTPKYLNALREAGVSVLHTSKWNNTAVVEMADTTVLAKLRALKFVKGLTKVFETPDSMAIYNDNRFEDITNKLDSTTNYYGKAQRQTEMINVQKLHEAGFRGEGMTIAVIDGGFYNADTLAALKTCKVLGTRNFVRPEKSVYEEQSHGMMVLSCIGANAPYALVGTAPEASFYLIQTEDGDTESLYEEDTWCAAVEYADSLGVDIITSSLGYTTFDDTLSSHRYWEADGHTAINSRSASLAASRGLLVLNSAGNSGNDRWKKIGFPADARNIITVGAVNADGKNTLFSSLGYTADGRVKPDVMAMGGLTALIGPNGNVIKANGTSFSTPVMCGAVCCLWQAFPNRKPTDIIRAVQLSGNNATHPDEVFGYGIPDLWKAYQLLQDTSGLPEPAPARTAR